MVSDTMLQRPVMFPYDLLADPVLTAHLATTHQISLQLTMPKPLSLTESTLGGFRTPL